MGSGPQLGPAFVVVGVFDGMHLGHAYLLEHLVARVGGARRARPTVITFDHHPDEVLMGTAPPLLLDPGRAARAARGGRRGGHRRPALRRGPAADAVRRLRRADPGTGRAHGLPDDARTRPSGSSVAARRRRSPSSGRATGSMSSSSRRSPSTARRSAARPSATAIVRRRPRRGGQAARPAGDDHRARSAARSTAAHGSTSRCRSPCRPMATTRSTVDGDAAHAADRRRRRLPARRTPSSRARHGRSLGGA